MQKKAIVLNSGGLDSLTCIAIAQSENYQIYALTIDYGQRSYSELAAAKRIAKANNVSEHKIFPVPLTEFGGSALTDHSLAVPTTSVDEKIPITYVPARNTIFISLALAWAEVMAADVIITGINAIDYSHYPDCRPKYAEAWQQLIALATKATVEGKTIQLYAPLLHLTKFQIIQKGLSLGVDYSISVSCYQADEKGRACNKCESCYLRKKGFAEAGVADPTRYI